VFQKDQPEEMLVTFQLRCKFVLCALDSLKWGEELISLALFVSFSFVFTRSTFYFFCALHHRLCFSNTMTILQQHSSSQRINLKTFKNLIHFSFLFLFITTNIAVKETLLSMSHLFLIMIPLGNICCMYQHCLPPSWIFKKLKKKKKEVFAILMA